ncbi:acylphosphatase [Salinibacillus kushneri]|uniref:Acylphosphatase n=1 Tax=Salinibacillus kushneri TaxID=237682 RepID=A0A1H9YXT0_9BACI|nr:acylphosphatase [Salinibacillus kushneri]SES73910.1 acylphosphatase [Salinibacillus kushneri]
MHAHAIVSGKVQGVGFRASAWRKANEYGVKGYARNLANGNVEMEVEGPADKVEDYLKEVKNGLSPFIRVDHMEVDQSETEKGYQDFRME